MRNARKYGAVLEFTIHGLQMQKVDEQLYARCRRLRTEDDMFAIIDRETGDLLAIEDTAAKADAFFWKPYQFQDAIAELNTPCDIHSGLCLTDIVSAIECNEQLNSFVSTVFGEDYAKQLELNYGNSNLELSACMHFKSKHVDFIYTCNTNGASPLSLDREVPLVGMKNTPRRAWRFTLLDVLQSLFSFNKQYRVNTLTKNGLVTAEKKAIKNPMPALLDMCELDVTLAELFQFVDEDDALKEFLKSYTWSPDLELFHAEAAEPVAQGKREYHLMEISRECYIGQGQIEIDQHFRVLGKKPGAEQITRFDFYDIGMDAVASLPVVINPLAVFQDGKHMRKFKSEFTLLEVLRTVYWEITGHGTPAAKKAYKAELWEAANMVKNPEVKHIAWSNSRA